jgi:integrase
LGIPFGKYLIYEAVMKGSIHSDQVCPICGSRFTPGDGKRALSCPNHPDIAPSRFVLRYGRKITKRFDSYEAALQVLTGLRFQEGAGSFDARDYQVKTRPLAFDKLAEEWLAVKAKTVKPSSLKPLRLGLGRAINAWGGVNIKTIKYSHIEDFINGLDNLSPKTKKHTLDALKQFWQWVVDCQEVPPIKKWPKLGFVEMAFRQTVDLETQEAILADISAHEPFRVWLCLKWLATYIAIRPGEMRGLAEGQVDRARGVLIIPHPKEKRAKIIPLIPEDMELVKGLPLAFDSAMPFFRHETARGGGYKAGQAFGSTLLYRAWQRACGRLGIQGVSVYPGTKHSTAMGLRAIATPEEIKSMTLHSTSAAFHRYFQTGGEALRELQSRRQSAIGSDKRLINGGGNSSKSQIFNFTK